MLSPRQRQVCELVKRGLSDREIGKLLEISEETVNYHLRKIFKKFGVQTRTEAALFFIMGRD